MINWHVLDSERRPEWDRLVAQAPHAPVFQTWGWGDFKQGEGWQPCRFVARDKGLAIVAFAQALIRLMPGGVKFVWVPGGPLRTCNSYLSNEMLATFHDDLERTLGRCYIRCNLMTPRDGQSAYTLARNMAEPIAKLNSGYSVLLDLTDDDAVWLASIEAKHRYYVRKSRAAGLVWRYDDGGIDFADLTLRMARDKGLSSRGMSQASVSRLGTVLPGTPRVLVGYLDGEAVTGCLALRCGPNAFYASAATIGRGREISAAYAMFAELRSRLRDEGVNTLDFGGIDPASKDVRGVDHFKRGFGGRVVEYLGEWESGSLVARILGNFSIALKRR